MRRRCGFSTESSEVYGSQVGACRRVEHQTNWLAVLAHVNQRSVSTIHIYFVDLKRLPVDGGNPARR